MTTKRSNPLLRARFAASLHPEIFYALQVLSDEHSRAHDTWKSLSLKRFPIDSWPIALPSALWPAVADVLDIEPTVEFDAVEAALETLSPRAFQERLLLGVFHFESAVSGLLDEGKDLQHVVGALPRAKREWLAHVGLYPVEPATAEALERIVRAPARVKTEVLRTLRRFWDSTFAETWRALRPLFEESVVEKRQLFDACSLQEFLRHTLLPIELDGKKTRLRALRGGYELPLSEIGICVFTPSVFNDARLWTVYENRVPHSAWLPYFEPDLGPNRDEGVTDLAEAPPDIALIFRALGDTTRFAMVSLIGRQPRTAVELATTLSVSKPTISHHIHILRSAGLIHETNHGGSVLISLRKSVLGRLSELATNRILESREPIELGRTRRQ